ncbi:deoxyribodipyrimidine photolyase [Thioclava sp. F1Mire-8]|uniref:cryptochrome/photolyase family protein n=1 Tax=Thioclava sp. F1Mire-8 TaxID=1973006 RepID=UPI000B53C6BE|nr:deoxyribodipyrimidine photo-lyase [Thioclava sp. F1Mire-8]OWY05108.1 deoxyribodipyrimidine photolyase [Thioclava sp. F1Mire-8]
MSDTPVLLWLRRDFRFHDNEAMAAAATTGAPVIPVFIHDDQVEALGAAAKWRLGLAVEAFAESLSEKDSKLILRKGAPLTVLRALIEETGAGAVYWSRRYDKPGRDTDTEVKSALSDDGIEAKSFTGHLLFEPWTVETKTGGPYKVYTPFWNAVKGTDVAPEVKTVSELRPPSDWPRSKKLDDWKMGAAMRRGAAIVAKHVNVGERAAQSRLSNFLRDRLSAYKTQRDVPASGGTSGLSENLTYGEISPRTIWHAGYREMAEGNPGAETFLKELVWREFAWHLFFHWPDMAERNWRDEWNGFDWRRDNNDAEAWRRGMTGEPFVDAAMREMYVTGTMHNRARMIVASYLSKHLMTDWRVGLRWFEDCLIDWDPASNAMGWQWVAGPGPDATPYFRVFNPETQLDKFDKDGRYRKDFIAEGQANPPETATDYFEAIPESWALTPDQDYPERLIGLKEGRERALAAYEQHKG